MNYKYFNFLKHAHNCGFHIEILNWISRWNFAAIFQIQILNTKYLNLKHRAEIEMLNSAFSKFKLFRALFLKFKYGIKNIWLLENAREILVTSWTTWSTSPHFREQDCAQFFGFYLKNWELIFFLSIGNIFGGFIGFERILGILWGFWELRGVLIGDYSRQVSGQLRTWYISGFEFISGFFGGRLRTEGDNWIFVERFYLGFEICYLKGYYKKSANPVDFEISSKN